MATGTIPVTGCCSSTGSLFAFTIIGYSTRKTLVVQCTRKILLAHELFKMKGRLCVVASMLAADEM